MGAGDSPRIGARSRLDGFDGVHADSPDSMEGIFTFASGDFLSKMGMFC